MSSRLTTTLLESLDLQSKVKKCKDTKKKIAYLNLAKDSILNPQKSGRKEAEYIEQELLDVNKRLNNVKNQEYNLREEKRILLEKKELLMAKLNESKRYHETLGQDGIEFRTKEERDEIERIDQTTSSLMSFLEENSTVFECMPDSGIHVRPIQKAELIQKLDDANNAIRELNTEYASLVYRINLPDNVYKKAVNARIKVLESEEEKPRNESKIKMLESEATAVFNDLEKRHDFRLDKDILVAAATMKRKIDQKTKEIISLTQELQRI